MKNHKCKLVLFRVTCAFIKNTKSAFSHKNLETENLDAPLNRSSFVHKNTAKHFVMEVWLVVGSMLKLLHVEIASFWIKTKVNLSPFLKLYL